MSSVSGPNYDLWSFSKFKNLTDILKPLPTIYKIACTLNTHLPLKGRKEFVRKVTQLYENGIALTQENMKDLRFFEDVNNILRKT